MRRVDDSFQLPLGNREERIAYNESWARDLNRMRAQLLELGEPEAGFQCECEDVACSETVHLTAPEWELVRSSGRQFVVAPHHVAADVESVVLRREGYWIVEKLGDAGEQAERLA
jgi:hypothetical protein